MTLSRQLLFLIVSLLALVFIGTFLVSANHSRNYLEQQLASHAQDAATSLGLSISTAMARRDQATIDSMTDAIFDRGFYRMIRIEDINGRPIMDRVQPVVIDGVPEWFIGALPLETPRGEAAVMSGWQQQGRVLVASHPGIAYRQLWDTVVDTLKWFLLSTVGALLVGLMVLRQVLKPLRMIERQAEAICNREFPVTEKLPRTPDMRRIVDAMNRMTQRVRQMLDELERLAAGLRRQALQNSVTGLPNRRFFNDTLQHLVASDEEFARGLLCLVQLKDFKGFNDRNGRQAGDELLKMTAERLERLCQDWPNTQLSHLSGADFAVLARIGWPHSQPPC